MSMDKQEFIRAYNESRNGANHFFFNPMYRQFSYSDGVKECAEAGCYWLLDIIGTECPAVMRKADEPYCLVTVTVANEKADIILTHDNDAPALWSRRLDWTDMPEGTWEFELVDEGHRFAFILISEH